MEKLKFEKLSQFISALEEGPLYAEDGRKFILRINPMVDSLVIDECDKKGDYIGVNRSLLTAKQIGLSHTFTRKPLPKDKALVWCWGGEMITKEVYFYDKKNNSVFDSFGHRNHEKYTNYEVIEPNEKGIYEHPFDWANEAVKKLED